MGRRLQQADEAETAETVESIYRTYEGRIRWVLRGRGVPEPALDDLVHDVFLAIHRRLSGRDRSLSLRTWVVGVARNVAFTHRRAAARATLRLADLPVPEPPQSPEDELARREAWVALERFLDELEPAQREVFVLVEMLGMPVVEVAQSTGVGSNTLYSRLRLARRKFQEHFPALVGSDQTVAFLGRARTEARPDKQRRARLCAAILADVGPLGVPAAGTGLLTKVAPAWTGVGALLGTAVVAAGVFAASSETQDSPVTNPRAAATVTPSAVVPSNTPPVPAPTPPPVPPTDSEAGVVGGYETPASSPTPAGTSSAKSDPVADQVALLRAAKGALTRGDAQAALAMADRFVETHGEASFGVDLHRIIVDAGCALGRADRVKRSAHRLGELGHRVDAATTCDKRPRR